MIFELSLVGYIFVSLLYVIILGKSGFTFFWLHIPFLRSRGAWYIKESKSKRVVVEFAKYADKLQLGAEKIETNIDQPYSHTASGDPVIFVQAGQLANFDPFKGIPVTRGAEWFSQLLIQNWNAAYNAGKSTVEKQGNMEKIMLILLAGILIGVLIVIVIGFQNSQILTEFAKQFEIYKPALDSAVSKATANTIV